MFSGTSCGKDNLIENSVECMRGTVENSGDKIKRLNQHQVTEHWQWRAEENGLKSESKLEKNLEEFCKRKWCGNIIPRISLVFEYLIIFTGTSVTIFQTTNLCQHLVLQTSYKKFCMF